MPDPALTWLGEDFLAALGETLEGADLEAPALSGPVAVVAPAQVGRPRRGGRGREAAASVAAASASPDVAPSEGRATLDMAGGRVVGWRPGVVADDPVATFTLPAADARAALEGRAEPSVLFMQGRLKVDGDMAAVLAILSATARPGYGRARATLEGRVRH